METCVNLLKPREKEKYLVDISKFQKEGEYVIMPSYFFPYENIPPPLIDKTWLDKIELNMMNNDGDEDSGNDDEDDVPLSQIISSLRVEEREDSGENRETSNRKFPKNNVKSNMPRVNRPRGRPKKVPGQNTDLLYNLCKNLEIVPENDLYDEASDISLKSEPSEFNWEALCQMSDKSNDTSPVIKVKNEPFEMAVELENETVEPVKEVEKKDTKSKKKGRVKTRPQIDGVLINGKKLVFPCPECHKQFSAISTLKNHLKLHEGNLHTCTSCGKGFITNYLLKCHSRLHTGDLFTCHTCGKGFITSELLKVHTRGHTGDRPFTCDICNVGFLSASNLQQHKDVHLKEKNFLCSECGMSFNQKRSLHNHMLIHNGKSHTCNICGKMWTRKSDLVEHTRVHTGAKPFDCKICQLKFTQASSLRRHNLTSHQDEPSETNTFNLSCAVCKKRFKSRIYYERHYQKHSPDKVLLFTSPNVENQTEN